MASKKNEWLKSKLRSLSAKTGKGISRDVRTIGGALGSPIRKGADWYFKRKARIKMDQANFEEAKTLFKNQYGHSYPKELYRTSKMRDQMKEIIEGLRNK